MSKQQKITNAVTNLITTAANGWQPKTLEQHLSDVHQADIDRVKKRQQEAEELIERLTWACEYCQTVHVPRKIKRHDGSFNLVKMVDCDCTGYQAELKAKTEKQQQLVRERRLKWLTAQPYSDNPNFRFAWKYFDTEWPVKNDLCQEPELAKQQLRTAKQKVLDWYMSIGDGVLLSGHYGCGKTHLLRSVVAACGNKGDRIAFYNEPELLSVITDGYKTDQVIRHCNQSKVLVLDDIGLEYDKTKMQWLQNKLISTYFRMLEQRAEKGLSTLFSTNCRFAEINDRLGGRVVSRIELILGSRDNWVGLWEVPDYRAKDF